MKKRISSIIQNRKTPLVLAFLIPFVITAGICIGREIWPFGQSTILHIDMYHQYAPFFTEFMNQLKDGGSLAYTWNLGLGTDFVSLMAYYLASPVNWLLFFCPRSYVIEFMTILILVKIGLCGFTFAYYLRSHYQDTGYKVVLFSTFYAMSGFICAYNWNIMWLDTVLLTPLIILGLERLVKEKKCTLYVVTLAISVLSNYYISIMLCFFLVLYFAILMLEEKGGRLRAIVRFGVHSLLAGGCGAVLILPEIAMLGSSGSVGGGFPEKTEWYFNILDEIARLCIGVEVIPTTDHWPNLYCGAAVILLFFLYLLNYAVSWKKKVPWVLLTAFFLISFANNKLDYIWHGMHFPKGLPGRESFLFAFVMLKLGYETVHLRKGSRRWHVLAAVFLSEFLLLACSFFTDTELVTKQSMLLTGLVILGYAMIYAFCIGKDIGFRRMAAVFASILVLVEAAVNMNMTSIITSSRYSYTFRLDEYKNLTERIRTEDASFFRIDKFNRLTKNESALSDYPSASVFSSLINVDVADFYREMGMEGGKNFYCYNGATMLTSAMLNVKYVMTDKSCEESPYRTLVDSENGIYLYENKYTLPLGYIIPSDLEERWDYTQGNAVTAQNELGYALGAEEPLLTEVSTEITGGMSTIHVEKPAHIYGYYIDKAAKSITAEIGEYTRSYSKCDHVYLLDLGYCGAGTDIVIHSDDTQFLSVHGYALNETAFKTVYNTLNEQTMTLDSYSDTNIKGHIDVRKEGNLMLSVPDDLGWSVYVDGVKTEYVSFAEAFISIPLTEGEHTIELSYHTPYLMQGALISTGSLLLFVLITFVRNKRRKMVKIVSIMGE